MNYKFYSFTSPLFLLLFTSSLAGQNEWVASDNPVELGQIHWIRNLDEAKKQSRQRGLPIFLLFQEVPGCSNCTTYGNEVLSHPFVVEVVESHFIPLAIFNNQGGYDREVLKLFKEPSWNNPVVRIINDQNVNLIPRLSGNFSQLGLAERISSALVATNQVTPEYFKIWLEELRGHMNREEAYLAMYCFWTGEREIAKIPGVISTEAGFMHGKEVVKVNYDRSVTSLVNIVEKAKTRNCADQVFSNKKMNNWVDKKPGKYRKDKEVKYYLSKSKYRHVPMTQLQSARVNIAISEGSDPNQFLSPRQLSLLHDSNISENFINTNFVKSWYKAIGHRI